MRSAFALLESWFDLSAFPDDPGNGLAVAPTDENRPLGRVGYAVNCSFEVIDDAVRQHVDLLLTHHAAWPNVDLGLVDAKRERLRQAGIAHYVCHLPLDCDDAGTAATLCARLGVVIEGPLADLGGARCAGRFGRMADGPLSFNAFIARVSDALGVAPYALPGSGRVERVGVITGAAGETTFLEEARASGCDTYLTGEGNVFTKLYARETGLNLVLGTHVATERPGIEVLALRLQAALPDVEIVGLRETPFE
jgi:putative NIF3 family GTP cyclohydrolase 1 type 2